MSVKMTLTLQNELVKCPRIKALIDYVQCKKCEFYKGRNIIMTSPDDPRPIEDVRCAMPVGRRIEIFVKQEEEVSNGSPE